MYQTPKGDRGPAHTRISLGLGHKPHVLAGGRRNHRRKRLQLSRGRQASAAVWQKSCRNIRSRHQLFCSTCSLFYQNTFVNKYHYFRKAQLDAEGSSQLLITALLPAAASPLQRFQPMGSQCPATLSSHPRNGGIAQKKSQNRRILCRSKFEVLASEKRSGEELVWESF